MKKYYFLFALLGIFSAIQSQSTFPYEIHIDSIQINGLPGLHSYAFAQHDGKWLVIGGRKDGIHARQPFAAFPQGQNNTTIYVIDINSGSFTSASVSSLSASLSEQLQSTNMNFCQYGDTLYILGGYAFSSTANDHITFPHLTSIEVSGLINAVENSQSITPYFKQAEDTLFAVTGGQLGRIGNTFYLVGGHQFDGRYNPMGHNTYVQTYKSRVMKFEVVNSGSTPQVKNVSFINDALHLHRRDFNLLPQIFPDGSEGFTISSGVFQVSADLPFLYPVDVKANGIAAQTGFSQYLSNYHSATSYLYDSVNNQMHSLFFGGMSQYYYENGTLTQDNQVPFVSTISRMSRDDSGNLSEHVFAESMPGLKASSAEFIPNPGISRYENEIIKLSALQADTILIGHIYGGIKSDMLNPFSSNQVSFTQADPMIYTVHLVKSPFAGQHEINGKHTNSFEVHPNPSDGMVELTLNLPNQSNVEYFLIDLNGRIIQQGDLGNYNQGSHKVKLNLEAQSGQAVLNLIFDNKYNASRRVLIKN